MRCKLHTKYTYLNRLPTRTSTSQFHSHSLSSTHRFHTRTTPFQQPKKFHTKNPSVPHQKPLSSTSKSLSSTPKTLLEVIILRNLSKINKIYTKPGLNLRKYHSTHCFDFIVYTTGTGSEFTPNDVLVKSELSWTIFLVFLRKFEKKTKITRQFSCLSIKAFFKENNNPN